MLYYLWVFSLMKWFVDVGLLKLSLENQFVLIFAIWEFFLLISFSRNIWEILNFSFVTPFKWECFEKWQISQMFLISKEKQMRNVLISHFLLTVKEKHLRNCKISHSLLVVIEKGMRNLQFSHFVLLIMRTEQEINMIFSFISPF